MQQFLQRFLGICFVLMAIALPKVAWEQRQSHATQSSHTTSPQDFDHDIYVLQTVTLSCELPSVHLQLVTQGGAGDPLEAWERLALKDGKQSHILGSLNDLRGHVAIIDGPTALRYVRLLTSSETWFLWKQEQLEVEVMEAGDAIMAPNYGLKKQPFFLSPPVTMADIKSGFQSTVWQYDKRTHKMELVRNTFQNDKDSDKVLKTKNPPDFTLLGNGSMGILPRKAYRAGGFSPATVLTVTGGFQITRWLYVEDYRSNNHGNKGTESVQQVQEFVGTAGAYRRTVLKTHSPPALPNVQLSIPKFE